ncbi:hypothetical protein HCN44_007008 [Aphidius gifuensis]|uniref:DNA/RNA non-specific endonuclease n=1 Tax=Aphidius gifuensis TaxID=684658 RepID=A0A834Y0X4_APHGI|nr:hypothetical protein HCN44_007008 [Aphidius gifuensis]
MSITMKKLFQLFFIVFFILDKTIDILANCKISIPSSLPSKYQPLYLYTENVQGFIHPKSGSKEINIESDDVILLACPGKSFTDKKIKSSVRKITCLKNGQFKFGDKNLKTLKDMKCSGYAQPTEKVYHNTECGNCGVKKSIGFNIETQDGLYEYYPVINFCREKKILHTVYVHLKVLSQKKRYPSQLKVDFRQGSLFKKKNMKQIYEKKCVFRRINKILGKCKIVKKYIGKEEDATFSFEKGHLVAKADVIFSAHKYATFNYANAVPMWKTINRRNWVQLENAIRQYADKIKRDLDVWTGSIGVLQLKDKDGILQNIYLRRDENFKNESVPVPKLLFKVVYDEKYQAGIVFVTINNPHIKIIEDEYIICKNICEKVSWIEDKKKDNFDKLFINGYTYCCEYSDFRKSFPYLPIDEIENIMVNDFFNI